MINNFFKDQGWKGYASDYLEFFNDYACIVLGSQKFSIGSGGRPFKNFWSETNLGLKWATTPDIWEDSNEGGYPVSSTANIQR